MSKETMRGIEFTVDGTVRTANNAYVILVDKVSSLYFPIPCAEWHLELVEGVLSNKYPFDLSHYGMYFSLLSMLKAHDIFLTQASFCLDKSGAVSCSFDVVEENELGVKVSRVPLLLADAVVVCALGQMPITVYGPAGVNFSFPIDKSIPKNGIISCIGEELSRAERISAIGEHGDQEGN
jgi:hypothetical protein